MPPPGRIFPRGWGAPRAVLDGLYDPVPGDDEVAIRWQPAPGRVPGRVGVRDGTFRSPRADRLPFPVGEGHVRLIPPPRGDRLVLLMGAWGDEGWAIRSALAVSLWRRGIGSLLHLNAMYGRRRILGRDGEPLETVADMGHLGGTGVVEGLALVRWARAAGYDVGVAGYSMGAHHAGLVSVLLDEDVPTALLAPPHSPAEPFVRGRMRHEVAWDALGGQDAVAELDRVLTRVSLLRLPSPRAASRTVLVAGAKDDVVLPDAVGHLHDHLPGSDLTWRPRGHLTLYALERGVLAAAVARSFDGA